MKINGVPYRSVWLDENKPGSFFIIDQRMLPHAFVVEEISTVEEAAIAIEEMHTRGAPMIGVTAAFGMWIAALEARKAPDFRAHLTEAHARLDRTRPTAINLAWALEEQRKVIAASRTLEEIIENLKDNAIRIAEEDAETCRLIGVHGVELIRGIAERKNGAPVNILTHCNAGWLACVDFGTATSPMYHAHDLGIPIHVYVDETRPRNQGARLTAWELGQHGIPHTVIVDNTGGHLMQHGMVDIVFVGSDRTTRSGDVANKIGTYLKALAANDNNVPFYVCLPESTFDWTISDGLREIPIETRSENEVKLISGLNEGEEKEVLLTPGSSPAVNYGFDVTPARLVKGLITERGICDASEEGIRELFPEKY